jgi:protein TonB
MQKEVVMVAYEGAVGSYIPGVDTKRGKPSKALVAALVVVSAAHAGLFAYLAYQKWVMPITTDYVDPPTTVIEQWKPQIPPPPPKDPPPPRPEQSNPMKPHIPTLITPTRHRRW